MSISFEHTVSLFNYLKTGGSDKFFEYVADNVLWTVMCTQTLWQESIKAKMNLF